MCVTRIIYMCAPGPSLTPLHISQMGILSTFAALPGFLMVVPCNLSVTEFDVCLPPLSKCYEIQILRSRNGIVIHSTRGVSEGGMESRRKVVVGQ